MKISVIIPMYNEASIIEDSIKQFHTYMKKTFEDFEIIFVDDGSKDGCAAFVEESAKSDARIRLVRYGENKGKGCAVRTGMLSATGDVAMFTDCDIAYGVEVIKNVYDYFANDDKKVQNGEKRTSVVVGSRNLTDDGYEGYTFIRKLASKIYIKVLCITAGFKLSDSQCGMKGFRVQDAKEIFSECEINGFAFDFEVLLTAKSKDLKIDEIPVKIINHRESKIHVFSDTFKMLKDLIKIKKRIKNKQKQEKKTAS